MNPSGIRESGRFGLGHFGPGSFRPNLVSCFGLILSKSPWVRYDRLKKNVMREGVRVGIW